MKKINLTSPIGNLFGILSRAALFTLIGAILMVTTSFGQQSKRVSPAPSSERSLVRAKTGSSKRSLVSPLPPAAGPFSTLSSSPVPMTCITADPTTGLVYGQENQGNRFFRYDPGLDFWEELASSPIDSGNNGGAAYVDGKIYNSYVDRIDLAIYDIASDSWTTVVSPLPFTGNITSDGTDLYLVRHNDLVRYNPAIPAATILTSSPIWFLPTGGLSIYNGFIYGHSGTDFAKYEIATGWWTILQSLPDGSVFGGAIDPVSKVYYAYGGSNWYSCDLVSETWSMSFFPLYPALDDGGMVYVDAMGVYMTFGVNSTGFGRMVPNIVTQPAGVFSASASSPAPLTCITADPATGYVYAQENQGNRFYRYLPFSDTWEQLADSPLFSSNNGGGAYINGKIYTTYTGGGELGVYTIATNSWTTIASLLMSTGDMTSDGANLYLAGGNSFVRYNPETDTTTPLAEPSINFQPWGGLAIFNGFVYGHSGNGTSGFAKYEIATDTWTTLPSIPDGAVLGCAIDPVGKVYYAYGNYGGSNWYSFDLVSETWTMSTFPLFSNLNDGGMVYVNGTGIYLTFSENSTGFGRVVLTAPTTVSSITLAGASPVSGPSASWTVTFNDAVSNVNAGNFVFEDGGMGGTLAITSVTPVGAAPATQWTVTANAGLGNGTLGLDMVNDTAISNAITGLPFVGEVYSFDRTAPVANSDSYSTDQDAFLNVGSKSGVLANDNDVNNDPLTAVLTSGTSNGALTLNSDGSFTYMPNEGFFGSDTFVYTAFDGTANSDLTSVLINVVPPEAGPTTMAFSSATYSGAEAVIETVTAIRSGDASGTSTVDYGFTDQTAVHGICGTAGVDYQGTSGTLTFEASETVKTINFLVCPDTRSENPAETALITLNNPMNGVLGAQSSAQLTMLDAASDFRTMIPVTISTGTVGSPYGTQVFLAGYPGRIGGIRVTLYGVTYQNPQNLQVLLVSPNGTGYELMAGTGMNTPLDNATITFEDVAPTYLPDTSAILDGVNYRPTVCGPTGPFPGPAPIVFGQPGCGTIFTKLGGVPNPTLAGTFGGASADGFWTLYVQDVGAPGAIAVPSDSIGGWGMQVLMPTAAHVSLSGQVRTASGAGIRNAVVTVGGGDLRQPITAAAGSFGLYKIDGMTAGTTYVVTVTARKYKFPHSVQTLQLSDDMTGFDFVANE